MAPKHALECRLDLGQVVSITVKCNAQTAAVQSLSFETSSCSLVQFRGQMVDGKDFTVHLQPSEQIVGVFGYLWSSKQPEIVGLGFVILN